MMLFDCLLASPGKSQPLVSLTSLYQWSVLSLWILLNSCCLCCSLQSRSCCPFLYVIIFGSWCASYGCMLMFSITSGKLCLLMCLFPILSSPCGTLTRCILDLTVQPYRVHTTSDFSISLILSFIVGTFYRPVF